MQEYQISQVRDLTQVVSLIDYTFREKDGYPPTMQQEFPLLLSLQNQQNIRTLQLSESNKLASVASFLPREILIQGYPIQAASVGAVCTDEAYMKKGYSSLILDDIERKLREDSVDVMLVSGRRNLYLRRGCTVVGSFYKYSFIPQEQKTVVLRKYKPEDLYKVIQFYNCQSTRFNRTHEDFVVMMQARAISWGDITPVFYLVEYNGEDVGYIFINEVNMPEKKSKKGEVVEAACPIQFLAKAIKQAGLELGLEEITCPVHQREPLNYMQDCHNKESEFQEGTVKIICFSGMMKKLNPYFAQYLRQDEMEKLQFNQDGTYSITFGNEKYTTEDINEINKLVFEGNITCIPEEAKALRGVLKKIFPIPMPWSGNLNYQ